MFKDGCIRRARIVGIAAAAIATVATGVGSGTAQAAVYWTEWTAPAISRANDNGTGVNRSFMAVPYGQIGLAVNRSNIFWGNYHWNWHPQGTVGRASLTGAAANAGFVTPNALTQGVAVDDTHVYWADQWARIGRAKLDGTAANGNFMTGLGHEVNAVAVSGSHIFYNDTNTNKIWRANLDGTNRMAVVTNTGSTSGVAVKGLYLYWFELTNGRIARARLDGSRANRNFITGNIGRGGLAVGAKHIYWGNTRTHSPSSIGRATLGGGQVNQHFIALSPGSSPQGVAVDQKRCTGELVTYRDKLSDRAAAGAVYGAAVAELRGARASGSKAKSAAAQAEVTSARQAFVTKKAAASDAQAARETCLAG